MTGTYFDMNLRVIVDMPPWWLAGDVNPNNVLAVYQPKDAVNYAESKVNIVNPGVHNAVDGTLFPVWSSGDGWTFSSSHNRTGTYLTTDISSIEMGRKQGSIIVKYSSLADQGRAMCLIGGQYESDSGSDIPTISLEISPPSLGGLVLCPNFDEAHDSPLPTSPGANVLQGIIANTPDGSYFNGNFVSGGGSWSDNVDSSDLYIGCLNYDFESGLHRPYIFASVKIQAIAIYNTTLTPFQVAVITSFLAAL
jgi:hypothetical protein